jgi:hypothetical protein
MPTPIVHLCVAKKIAEIRKIRDKPSFYLGSIAPDSFYLAPTYHDIDGKYERHIAAHTLDFADTDCDFRLGYRVHILTDTFWKARVFSRFSGTREEYYRDAQKFDREFFTRYELGSDVWEALAAAEAVGLESQGRLLVSADEVASWRDGTLRLFRDYADNRDGSANFFTREVVEAFIEDAAAAISEDL